MMGIVVGMLGVRGSHSLNTQTIKMYYVGLVMCAIVSMVIRVEVLFDIIAGKVSRVDCRSVSCGATFLACPETCRWERGRRGGGRCTRYAVCSGGDCHSCGQYQA